MKSHFYLIILAGCLLFFGCEETTKTPTTLPATTATEAVAKPLPMLRENNFTTLDSLLSKGKKLDIEAFNKSIIVADDAKENWVTSPFLIALQYTSDQLESASKKIEVVAAGPEAQDQIIITITEDGMLDDSVMGSLTILKLLQTDKLWQIEKAGQLWKCWPDRNGGESGFSTEPCG